MVTIAGLGRSNSQNIGGRPNPYGSFSNKGLQHW